MSLNDGPRLIPVMRPDRVHPRRGFAPKDTFGGIFEALGLLEDLKRLAVLDDLVRKPVLSRDGGDGNVANMKVSLYEGGGGKHRCETALQAVSSPQTDLGGALSRDGSDGSDGGMQVSLLSVGRKGEKRVMVLP